MKRNRLLFLLVLLMTAAGGAWAQTVTYPKYLVIGVFECTQYQWKAIMIQQWSETTNPSTRPSWFNNESYWETSPVERVSDEMIRGGSKGMGWPDNDDVDANSFMDILRTKTGMKFDLPTEAQWEYACRAGTTTALNSGTDMTIDNIFNNSKISSVCEKEKEF